MPLINGELVPTQQYEQVHFFGGCFVERNFTTAFAEGGARFHTHYHLFLVIVPGPGTFPKTGCLEQVTCPIGKAVIDRVFPVTGNGEFGVGRLIGSELYLPFPEPGTFYLPGMALDA